MDSIHVCDRVVLLVVDTCAVVYVILKGFLNVYLLFVTCICSLSLSLSGLSCPRCYLRMLLSEGTSCHIYIYTLLHAIYAVLTSDDFFYHNKTLGYSKHMLTSLLQDLVDANK